MTRSRFWFVSCFAFAAACDSPGGGGGVIVDCSRTPELPICAAADATGGDGIGEDTSGGPDVVTPADGVTSDATDTGSPGDTGSPNDSGPSDTTFEDTTSGDTAPADTAPADTSPPACQPGALRCTGQRAEMCGEGVWFTVDECFDGETCQGGACVSVAECEPEERRCNGSAAEICVEGQWLFSQSCPTGCSDGSCLSSGGDLDCQEVVACGDSAGCFADPPTDSACFAGCLAQGSSVGRAEAQAMIGCYDSCGWDGLCAYDSCSATRAACLFESTGNGDCTSIDSCSGGCSDQACVDGCYEQATAGAQADYLWLVGCVGLYCELADNACVSQVIGAGQPCEDAFATCFN